MGNDQTCEILGIGKIKLKLHDGTVCFLTGVRYILDFKKNLILVGLLESKGFKIAMENGTLKILNGALVVMMATRHRNSYFLKGSTIVGGAATVSDIIGELASDITRFLGHPDDSALQRLVKQDLLKDVKTCKFEFCELCILGKQIRVKLDIVVHVINGTLDYVHTDVWGLAKVASFGGRHYFVNDYSRQVWVKGTTFRLTVTMKDIKNGIVTVIYNAKEVVSGLKASIVKDPMQEIWPSESGLVWSEVSQAILNKNWEKAKKAKNAVEEKQRELLRERESREETWFPKHFTVSHSNEGGWDCSPIQNRVPPAPIVVPL
ncbi:transposable element gene [Fagus crenata]